MGAPVPTYGVLLCREQTVDKANFSKGKGKGAPITGHEGPEGEQRYSPTLS